jgi:hypothetical protein
VATEVVSTIRSSGGDYTTLSAWEAGEQGDLVTADEIRTAECYDDWPSGLVDNVTIDGSTTDSTRYMRITVASGHRHTGTPQSGFYMKRAAGSSSRMISIADDYLRCEWLDVENTTASGAGFGYTSGTGVVLLNCIAKSGASASAFANIGSGVTFLCCLAWGGTYGFQFVTGTTPQVLNCVAANASNTGFRASGNLGGGAALKNCVAYNNPTPYSAASFGTGSTHNATDSASDDAPGGDSVTGISSSDFVDAANNDFHLASGSALIGAGTNLYSDFTTDIDGDTWPSSGAWDIGFDYRVAAGGQTVAIGQATETDTAQAFTAVPGALAVSIGQASETDLAQAFTPATGGGPQTVAIGQVLETDLAQAFTAVPGAFSATIGQAQELDESQTFTRVVGGATAIQQAQEQDAAQPFTAAPGGVAVVIGQPQESDVAQAMAVQAVAAITAGMVFEIDLAQPVTGLTGGAAVAIGQVSETDTALPVTAVGGGIEIDFSAIRRISSGAVAARVSRGAVLRISVEA